MQKIGQVCTLTCTQRFEHFFQAQLTSHKKVDENDSLIHDRGRSNSRDKNIGPLLSSYLTDKNIIKILIRGFLNPPLQL